MLKVSIYEKKKYASCMLILFLMNICLNYGIQIKGFFMDDLYNWSLYHSTNKIQFILNTAANKFRPIPNLFMLLGYEMVGDNTELLSYYLLMINFSIVMTLFYIIIKITRDTKIALASGIVFLFSSFSYYIVGQYFGVMEGLGVIFSILSLYYIYAYINSINLGDSPFYKSCIMIILAIFTHERYMCLVLLLLLAVVLKKREVNHNRFKVYHGSIVLIMTLLVLYSRNVILGENAFDGTGGTSILDELKISNVVKFFFNGLMSLLGINMNDAYLNGISYKNVDYRINIMIGIFIFCIISVGILISKIGYRELKEKRYRVLKNTIIFICFIGLTLGASCTTIRLESRWLYTPLAGALVLFAYWINYIKNNYEMQYRRVANILLVIFVVSNIPVQTYYRAHYPYVYFSGRQGIYNDLYEQTIKKYGDNLYMRPIVIVEEEEIFIYEEEVRKFFYEYKSEPWLNNPDIYIYRHLEQIEEAIKSRNPIVILVDSANPYDGNKKQVMDITREYLYNITKNNND